MKPLTVIAPLLLIAPIVLAAAPRGAASGQEVPVLQPPRDGQTADKGPAGTASVLGMVTVSGTGAPARKARVSLSGGDLRGGQTVTTDDMGRFAFNGLPAGRYTLSASKPGHVTVRYGQRWPGAGRPGTPIQLGDGQQFQAQIQIPRGGVITGTILDERGEAVPGTSVRVLRYAMQDGRRTLQQAGSDSTDDRGVYRVYGLQPGDYVVAATPRNATIATRVRAALAEAEAVRAREALVAGEAGAARVMAERMASGLDAPADDEGSGYAPVYYPGTTALEGAATVGLGISEEKMGIDFSLQLVPIATIEGIVVTSSGEPARNIRVSLMNAGTNVPGAGNNTVRPDPNGRFRISHVAPGRYLLVARGTIGGRGRGGRAAALAVEPAAARGASDTAQRQQPPQLWAMTDVMVDGRDLSNLVLSLQPGMSISGRLVFEGVTTMPTDLTRVRVTASPADVGVSRQVASPARAQVDATGRFRISGVVPGHYRLTASGDTQGWTLASAVLSGQDTLDVSVAVKPNENVSGAVLTFTDRHTEIAGTIVNERGEPASDYTVIVFPAEPHYWTPGSRRISSQRPGTDGRFTFRNLPPGDYLLTTVLDPEPGGWYDPAYLQQLESRALRVPLSAGESRMQNLRVGG